MRHLFTLTSVPFEKIAAGHKVIESRLYDEKRQKISPGDEITFVEIDKPESVLTVKVKNLSRYQTFKELFTAFDPAKFGHESTDSLLAEIHSFYSTSDEKKYGVVGIHFELIS